ncbi:MAG: branched-chain amino acid ABC transporter permease [Fimbriimonas sp.]
MDFSTLPQQVVNGILLGSIYALVALGYTMVYGVLRLINFAHGEVFMIGAYCALFASWALGFVPNNSLPGGGYGTLIIMLVASMAGCGLLGVIIERFAYRPLRGQPRIASLITAIGLSLLLQYGGQVFLPINQNIDARVSPLQGNFQITFGGAAKVDTTTLKAEAEAAKKVFDDHVRINKEDPFNLSAKGKELRDAKFAAERKVTDAKGAAPAGLTIPKGRMLMVFLTLVLMGGLTYLVMFTRAGRAMRAASHDFDAASLMGVNVDRIVTFTFLVGSVLAGAGAMMVATFYSGTKIDTFFGMLLGVKAFVAAVLGGIGNIPGAVVGALVMGVTESLVVWAGFDQYKDAVAFVVLIVVLLFRPGGIFGSAKVEKV